jgi:hypothetical protein
VYSTCLFCHAGLGANELVEHFPVGRRLAFDPERGRLWVVCKRCTRWNLTPLEERWEAIEECERLFAATPLRASTEHIGLAKLPEGLELVRIGRPGRPEFAAWRYGTQFGRRRLITTAQVGLGLGVLGAVVAGGAAVGVGIGGFGYLVWQAGTLIVKGSPNKVIARLPAPGGQALTVRRKHLPHLHLFGGSDAWELGVPHRRRLVRFGGDEGLRAAAQLLPSLNRFGGSKEQVSDAVRQLEQEPDPQRYFAKAAQLTRKRPASEYPRDDAGRISALPDAVRLALEMAAHEESERRAFEGELAALEDAWRDAEEIAAIADDMFLPESVVDFIRRHRPSR